MADRPCPPCDGAGGWDLSDEWDVTTRNWQTCPDCGGTGRVND